MNLYIDRDDDKLTNAWIVIWAVISDSCAGLTEVQLGRNKFFLEEGGIDYFVKCKKKFPHNLGLQRGLSKEMNPSGAIGFIANHLRPNLMSEKFMDSLLETIQTEQKTHDVSYKSYRAMEILNIFVSDGKGK